MVGDRAARRVREHGEPAARDVPRRRRAEFGSPPRARRRTQDGSSVSCSSRASCSRCSAACAAICWRSARRSCSSPTCRPADRPSCSGLESRRADAGVHGRRVAADRRLFGLAPALRATRIDVAPALRNIGRSVHGGLRSGKLLCVAQVALSLAAAGRRRALRAQPPEAAQPGFRRRRAIACSSSASNRRAAISATFPDHARDLDRRTRICRRGSRPSAGVASCSLAQFTPTTLRGNNVPFDAAVWRREACAGTDDLRELLRDDGNHAAGGTGLQRPRPGRRRAARRRRERDVRPSGVRRECRRTALADATTSSRSSASSGDSRYTNLRGETPPIVYQTVSRRRAPAGGRWRCTCGRPPTRPSCCRRCARPSRTSTATCRSSRSGRSRRKWTRS